MRSKTDKNAEIVPEELEGDMGAFDEDIDDLDLDN
jgi:hypothetical protein